MRPFGQALQYALENARIDTDNIDFALWIEEDYHAISHGKRECTRPIR